MLTTRNILDLYNNKIARNVHTAKIQQLKNADGTPNQIAVVLREKDILASTNTLEEILNKPSDSFPDATQFKLPNFHLFTFTRSGVIKINAVYKNSLQEQIANRATVIHVGEYHPRIFSIKLNFFYPSSKDLFPLFPAITLVTVHHKNNSKEFFLNYDTQVAQILCDLWIDALSLGLTEVRFKKSSLADSVKPKEYWDNWDQESYSEKIYQTACDPAIIQQFIDYIVPFKKSLEPNQKLKILDIGAGSGRLAIKILKIAEMHQLPVHYYFIEPSKNQITLAQTALAAKTNTSQCTITFINARLDEINLTSKVDCIISSGGPINRSIIDSPQAKKNLTQLASLLSPNGMMLATGLSPFLVKGKDFVANGLKPLRYSSFFTVPDNKKNDDMYQQIQTSFASFYCLATYVCKKLPPITPATEMIASGNKLYSGKQVYVGSFTEMLSAKNAKVTKQTESPLLYKPF